MSLRSHFDFTSNSLRFHFDFTSISLRFHFDFTSISLLKHQDKRRRTAPRRTAPRRTAPGVQTPQNHSKNTQNTPGPHQDAPEHTRTHRASPRALTKACQIKKPKTVPQGRAPRQRAHPEGEPEPEPEEDYSQLQTPAAGTPSSHAHTASHRTHERNETISRLSNPPTSDMLSDLVNLNVCHFYAYVINFSGEEWRG